MTDNCKVYNALQNNHFNFVDYYFYMFNSLECVLIDIVKAALPVICIKKFLNRKIMLLL